MTKKYLLWLKLPVWLAAFVLVSSCQAPGSVPAPTPVAAKPSTPTSTLTSTASPIPPTATSISLPPTLTPTLAPGTVTGSICYPSQKNPPITLFLKNTTTAQVTEVEIPQASPQYMVTVPPGEYIAYALTVGTEVSGTYSQAVTCGLNEVCTDHRPLPFQVQSGETRRRIDLCDWYNPPGPVAPPPNTPDNRVMVTAVQKINVFTGPGLNYPLAGFVPSRDATPALNRTADSSWLQIKYPSVGGSAWIYAPLVQVGGPFDTLPIVAVPDPPKAAQARLLPSTDQFTPAIWNSSFNDGVVHFKGSIKDKRGRPVNGFSILADNGTWSVLSHPTGASHWYPDLKDGAWDIIITNATDAAGWWTLTVVSYDCPNFEGGFNAQCKQFTRLSANQLVQVVYPDETVIMADWICHHDCDKGLYSQAYRPDSD